MRRDSLIEGGNVETSWDGRWYAKTLASGTAIWMLPALAFGPLGVGPLAMDQGLALLIAAGAAPKRAESSTRCSIAWRSGLPPPA